jgi:hypothetical protein
MREIIHQYGEALLDAVVFIAMITLLFINITDDHGNKGIVDIVAANIPNESPEYCDYSDFDIYAKESGSEKPCIIYNAGAFNIGSFDPAGCFEAYDSEGKTAGIKVLSVRECGGDFLMPDEDGKFDITEEGIYTVRVSAIDSKGRKSIYEADIPMNR